MLQLHANLCCQHAWYKQDPSSRGLMPQLRAVCGLMRPQHCLTMVAYSQEPCMAVAHAACKKFRCIWLWIKTCFQWDTLRPRSPAAHCASPVQDARARTRIGRAVKSCSQPNADHYAQWKSLRYAWQLTLCLYIHNCAVWMITTP